MNIAAIFNDSHGCKNILMNTIPDPKVIHSPHPFSKLIHLILVRPQEGRNLGAIARASANMGVDGKICVVGNEFILNKESWRVAKHAQDRLHQILHFPTLEAALDLFRKEPTLSLAATARVGSAGRPHPMPISEAVPKAMEKLSQGQTASIVWVFGPEADGLNNAEVAQCDWIVHIPSSQNYRSLNLSHAVMLFCYEASRIILKETSEPTIACSPNQKERLIMHLVELAQTVGFILPDDPHKMKPRLEQLLSHLPNHIHDIKTIHGWIDQTIRSVKKGSQDFKGRYRFETIQLETIQQDLIKKELCREQP